MTLKPNNIPGDMIFLDQWICWVTEMRDGKPTKIPKSPNSSRNAGTDSPETWGSFTEAKEAYEEKNYDGIGFVFTEDDEFLGVDLDDCRDDETGEWKEWALNIIEQLGGFIEISPSGTGGHVILKGEIPGNRNRKGDVEMYEDGRYFTVTGDVVDTNGERLDDDNVVPTIQDAENGLKEVYTEYLEDEDDDSEDSNNSTKSRSTPALDLDDHQNESTKFSSSTGANLDDLSDELQEIVLSAKKSRNGHKFTQLWRGNWEQVYPPDEINPNSGSNNTYSQSEADMAFCGMLAFWCSGDAERMDKIFRASGLMRRKWKKQHFSDGSTYGEHTIQRALDEVENYYDEEYYQNEVKGDVDEFENNDTDDDEDDGGSGTSTDNSDEEENDPDDEVDTENQNRSSERDGIDEFVTGADTESTTSCENGDTEFTSVEDTEQDNSKNGDGDSQTSSRNDDRDISMDNFESIHTEYTENKSEDTETENGGDTSNSDSVGEIPEPSADDSSDEEYYTELNEKFEEPEPEQDVESAEKSEGGLFDNDTETDDTYDDADTDDQDEETDSEPEIDISKEEGKGIIDDLEDDNEDDNESPQSSTSENQQTKSSGSNSTNTESDETLDTDPFDTTNDNNTTDDSESDTLTTSELEQKVKGDNENEIPEHVNQKIQAILAKINELENTAETNKDELLNDIKLEDDKLEQIYRELLEFEKIVKKRNEQFETIQQTLILLCRSHPNPIFKEIAEVLSQEEEIPMQNIFGEESMEQISAHDIELAAKGSIEREETNNETRATETESSTEDDSSSSTLSRLF